MKKSKISIGIIGTVLSTLMIVYTFLMIVFQQLFGATGDRVASGLCAGASVLILAGSITLIVSSDSRRANIVSAVLLLATSVICIVYPTLRTLGVLAGILTLVLLFVLILEAQKKVPRKEKQKKVPKQEEKKKLPKLGKADLDSDKKDNIEEE